MFALKIVGSTLLGLVGTVVVMLGIWTASGTVLFDPEDVERGNKSKSINLSN